jgi:hypothetical protein
MVADPDSSPLESPSIGWLEKIAIWTTVFFAGNANQFARSLDSWAILAAPIGYLCLHIALAWKKRIKFGSRFLILIGGFTLYFVASTIQAGEFHSRFWAIYVLIFSCCYVLVNALGRELYESLEKSVVWLSGIALFLWLVQIALPSVLVALIRAMAIFPSTVTAKGVNGIIYSVQTTAERIPRNCGFAWEPGGFASILVFAILLNLTRTGLRWKANPSLWILIAALMSTQSTTGWTTAGVLVVWFVVRQKLWFLWAAAVVPVVLLAWASPMMGEKLMGAASETQNLPVDEAIDNALQYETIYTPQRFASFQISLIDFKKRPLLGFGGHESDSYLSKIGIRAVLVSGAGEILRKFGIVGALFFVFSTLATAVSYARRYDDPWAGIALIGVTGFVCFSYSQILLPYFMVIWGESALRVTQDSDPELLELEDAA